MKLTLKTADLLKAVSFAAAVAPNKAHVPVFTHLLMANDNGSVEFTGSDNLVWATHRAITDQKEKLRIAIPGHRVKEFLLNVKDETVHLEVSKSKLVINSESTKRAGFPILDDTSEFTVPSKVTGLETGFSGEQLKTKLGQVIHAVADETDTRFILQGVRFGFQGGRLEMIGANGSFMLIASLEAKGEGEFIIPRKLAQIVLSSLDETDVDAVFSDRLAQFATGEWSITGRLIDGRFPGVSHVIPAADVGQMMRVSRPLMLAAAKQADLFAGEGLSRWITISGEDNRMTLTCGEDYEKEIPAECGKFQMHLPPDNLIDTLSAMQSDLAVIKFVDKLTAVQFLDVDFMALIMQMRG